MDRLLFQLTEHGAGSTTSLSATLTGLLVGSVATVIIVALLAVIVVMKARERRYYRDLEEAH